LKLSLQGKAVYSANNDYHKAVRRPGETAAASSMSTNLRRLSVLSQNSHAKDNQVRGYFGGSHREKIQYRLATSSGMYPSENFDIHHLLLL